jgi:hypothetical protein
VNRDKHQIAQSGDPFHEYNVMKIAREFDLPCPRPVAKVEQAGDYLIVMERIEGMRWDETLPGLLADGQRLTWVGGIDKLKEEAGPMMLKLQQDYEAVGLTRTWKLKDMIFDLDVENRKLNSVTPTDWERTCIDLDKVTHARRHKLNGRVQALRSLRFASQDRA